VSQIRDPIHGSIHVTEAELALIDSPFFQRLRTVKQLGFGELAFPGATHTRYAHSMGAMHLASRVVDALLRDQPLTEVDRTRLRQAARLAILFHDVGHAPLSHASEAAMPAIRALELPVWCVAGEDPEEQASHEHYTLSILVKSELASLIREHFGDLGITPESVAGLVAGKQAPGENTFVCDGVDYGPLLSQIVSGELDADRMDYLLRDSFYTGANYGRYDLDWIVQNLGTVVVDNQAHMGIDKRAIFAFEDFLLSRYHMFLSVYFHYTPICFDNMLLHYYQEAPEEYVIPPDCERFLEYDDVHLISALRRSENRWAQAIVRRKAWKLLVEVNELDRDYDLDQIHAHLEQEGIESFRVSRSGVLSKYFGRDGTPPLYLEDDRIGRVTPIQEYTPLYERYQQPMQIYRIYCDPDEFRRASLIVQALLKGS
jgi:HD superfamily phosphohydrolase